jgi:glycosyltransferase involved in cell wall biosynthesis
MLSVALCTFNGAKYLQAQLDSLAAQASLPCELHVGDDGSTDDTLPILQEFRAIAPFPVQITVNEHRLGFAENFIRTAQRCAGEWIAFCDQDDVWEARKVERCLEIVGAAPAYTKLVVHNALMIGADGEMLGPIDKDGGITCHPRLSVSPTWMVAGFRQVFHRDLIHRISTNDRRMTWREARYIDAHDAWVPLLASATGSVVMTGENLVNYRRHESNTTPLPGLNAQETDPEASLIGGAAALEAAASLFEGRACDAQMERMLGEAAEHYRSVAELMRERHALRTGPGRLGHFARLLRSGAYSGGGFERFGKRGFLDDMQAIWRLSRAS